MKLLVDDIFLKLISKECFYNMILPTYYFEITHKFVLLVLCTSGVVIYNKIQNIKSIQR